LKAGSSIQKKKDRIPAAVAEMIARALPHPGGHSVADVRARMLARQRMYEKMSKVHQ
jgi:hypothetical protein